MIIDRFISNCLGCGFSFSFSFSISIYGRGGKSKLTGDLITWWGSYSGGVIFFGPVIGLRDGIETRVAF